MARYHLTDLGPMKCSAQIECPLQRKAILNGEDPNQIFHYENHAAAMAAYSDKLEKKNSGTIHDTLKKPTSKNIIVENLELDEQEQGFMERGFLTGQKISGYIDPDRLDENSYKDFGFHTWTRDELISKMDMSNHKSLQSFDSSQFPSNDVSEYELKEMDEEDFGVLNFYTTNSFDSITVPLHDRNFYDDVEDNFDGPKRLSENEIFKTNRNPISPAKPIVKQRETKQFIRFGVERMDKALVKGIKKQRIVYRGAMNEMAFRDLGSRSVNDWINSERRLGNVVEYDGYTSTSYNFYKASMTYGGVGTNFKPTRMIYEILTPEGVSVTAASMYPSEEEVILPRKQRYVIVGHQVIDEIPRTVAYGPKEETVHIIQMIAVDEDNNILDGTNSKIPESPFTE